MAADKPMIWVKREAKSFCKGVWTTKSVERPFPDARIKNGGTANSGMKESRLYSLPACSNFQGRTLIYKMPVYYACNQALTIDNPRVTIVVQLPSHGRVETEADPANAKEPT
jgi:hypothetical protein